MAFYESLKIERRRSSVESFTLESIKWFVVFSKKLRRLNV